MYINHISKKQYFKANNIFNEIDNIKSHMNTNQLKEFNKIIKNNKYVDNENKLDFEYICAKHILLKDKKGGNDVKQI